MELFGYIDPSTGSLFIQAAFGTLLAVGVIMKSFFRGLLGRVKLAFSRQTAKHEEVN